MPIAHVSLPVSSIPTATTFYLAALKPLGYSVYLELENAVGLKLKFDGPDFWIHKCPEGNGREALRDVGVHVALKGNSRRAVREFHAAALKAGAKDNGAPGERPQYVKGYYSAYVIDPEGNNLECVCYQPWWLSAFQLAPSVLGAAAVGALAWWIAKRN